MSDTAWIRRAAERIADKWASQSKYVTVEEFVAIIEEELCGPIMKVVPPISPDDAACFQTHGLNERGERQVGQECKEWQ